MQVILYPTLFRLQLILFFLFLAGRQDLSLHRFPPSGSLFTRHCSKDLPAVSIIFTGQSSLPPTLISFSFCCISFCSSLLGVGGTKIKYLYFGPSQDLAFLLFSNQRAELLHSFSRYISFSPDCSASSILLYSFNADIRISFLNLYLI